MQIQLPLLGKEHSIEVGDFQGVITFPDHIIGGSLMVLVWFNSEASKQIKFKRTYTLSEKYPAGTFNASIDSHGIVWLELELTGARDDQEIMIQLIGLKENILNDLHLLTAFEPVSGVAFQALLELAEIRRPKTLTKHSH